MNKIFRKCLRCGVEAHTKEGLKLFAPTKKTTANPYGKLNWCNKCRYQYYHAMRMTNQRVLGNRRKQGQRHYERHKEKISEEAKLYRKLNPQKFVARTKAKTIPLGDSCELCGSDTDLHRHHPDYSYPGIFVTVCCACHHTIHNLNCKGSRTAV